MRNSMRRAPAVLLIALAVVAPRLSAQAAQPPSTNPFTGDRAAATQGAVLFRQECVFCHGVAAKGGMRGPDLTTGSWSHGGSDAELFRTINDGVPGTAMPPNALPNQEIWRIITYLRSVQQPAVTPAGDRARGETLFSGASRCSSCHMVNGSGGRLGPELSRVGSARSRAYLVESIREPNRRLTQNQNFGGATLKYDTVTAVTGDGRTIVGVPMNEDTFTVQLMDSSERVHSLDKRTLKSLTHEDRSLMPAYDERRLNNADLDDVLAYLQSLRSATPSPKKDGSQ